MVISVATLDASCQMQGNLDQNCIPNITPREAYNQLLNTSVEMAYLDTMISLSEWDQDISMPQNATEYRAKAQSYLVDLEEQESGSILNSAVFSLLPIMAATGRRSKPPISGSGIAITTRG